MQDRYAGDMGDFSKLGLARVIAAEGLTVGVNWYYTPTPASEVKADGTHKQADGRHLVASKYHACDRPLAEALLRISQGDPDRSVLALMDADLVPGATYFAEAVPTRLRAAWHRRALAQLAGSDVVIMDPDNGMIVRSVTPGSPKSVKYVLDEELLDYTRRGQSLVIYNHRPRKEAKAHLAELKQRLSKTTGISGEKIFALTFPKGSVRDYLIVPATKSHEEAFARVSRTLLEGPWGELGLCRDDE